MSETWYSLEVFVNGSWDCATAGVMSEPAAVEIYEQLAAKHLVRLLRGYSTLNRETVRSNANA